MDHRSAGDLAARQHGVISYAQARELGLTPHQIKERVISGCWERLHLEVFRIRGAPDTYRQRLVAACLAIGPEVAASHRSAATLHGLLSYREPPVEVTTTRARSPEVAGVVVHRLADLRERWIEVDDGNRLTTVARTLVDLGAVASPGTVEAALDKATGRRLLTYREARDAMFAVARKGRRGVGAIRRLLDERIGRAYPAGVLEARMESLLRRGSLPAPRAQHVVVDEHGGFVAVVDFAYPDRRLAVEVDGYEFHSTPKAVDYGNARDRLLVAAGWTPVHFSWNDVERRPDRVAEDLRRLLGTLKAP
jgi:very-short-patch-repair endonuclease